MSSNFALGIVAHTSRAEQAKALGRQTRADFVSIDNGQLGCEGNHRTVQQHLTAFPSTWSVILEDDAQVIESFTEQLNAALVMAPSPIVSLYLGRSRPRQVQRKIVAALAEADTAGAHWIIATRLLHAVGYAVRTELLESLMRHDSKLPADEHITAFAQRYGHTVSYSVGSLVDHADGPTVVTHRDGQPRPPGRRAWRVGGHERWTSTAVTMR